MFKYLAAVFITLFAQQVLAQPSPQIAKMIETPATAFDMFLYRLYEAAKCNNILKNNNTDEADLCLSSLSYDADQNVLSVFFRVLPGAEVMDDFVDLEADGRKAIMLQLLDNTAKRVGAVDSWGLLHSTPISHGWNQGMADEKLFRAELAKHTSTALSTSYDGVVYIATRLPDGTVKYRSNQ
jgi:hypothetical protein